MASSATEPDPAQNSARRNRRLLLSLIAVSISFGVLLRARFVPLNDLYSPWYGVQQLVLRGRNPYSSQVSQETQVAFYGHVLQPAEGKNEQRFAYPIFVIVLLWPLAFLQYATMKAIALPLLIAAGAAYILVCVRFMGWPGKKRDQLAAIFLGLSTTPMVRALRVEQLSTLVALFLLASFLALSKRRLIIAGMLLALATIKPQMALLPILWATIWALSNWQERKKLLVSLTATLALFFALGQLVLPGWIADFVATLPAYSRYAGGASFLIMLAGKPVGLAASALLGGVGAWSMCRWRREPGTNYGFQFTTALLFALTALTMPTMAAGHNLVLLFPGAFLLLRDSPSRDLAVFAFFVVLLSWTPVAAVADALTGHTNLMWNANAIANAVAPLIILALMIRNSTGFTARTLPMAISTGSASTMES